MNVSVTLTDILHTFAYTDYTARTVINMLSLIAQPLVSEKNRLHVSGYNIAAKFVRLGFGQIKCGKRT